MLALTTEAQRYFGTIEKIENARRKIERCDSSLLLLALTTEAQRYFGTIEKIENARRKIERCDSSLTINDVLTLHESRRLVFLVYDA